VHGAQLERDQHRAAERGHLHRVTPRRHESHRQGQGDGRALHHVQNPRWGVQLTPHAEGRVAPGLVADGAVIQLTQTTVGDERQHSGRHDDREHAGEHPGSPPAARARSSRGEQGREGEGGELRRRAEPDRRRAGGRGQPASRGVERQAQHREHGGQRHERVVGVRLEGE